MTKYQELIKKIQIVKQKNPSNFTSSELELITAKRAKIKKLEKELENHT